MFADVADKPVGALRVPLAPLKAWWAVEACGRAKASLGMRTRGLRLNMANNPKKVKDPTEVALSAIQEALNISDVPAADDARSSVRGDVTNASSTSGYNESAFDTRPSADRTIFEPLDAPHPARR